jgi:hypothetical protein
LLEQALALCLALFGGELCGSGALREGLLGVPELFLFGVRCARPELEQRCRRRSCLSPRICPHLGTDQRPLIELLRRERAEKQGSTAGAPGDPAW